MDIGGAETHITELCRVLIASHHRVTVLSPYGVYTEKLKKYGACCIAMPAYRKSVRSFLAGCKAVYSACRMLRPDVVHSHARPIALQCAIVCHQLGLPHVTTAHLPFARTSIREYMTVWGDATLSVSRDITRHLQKVYGLSASRIFETVNGIDTKIFRASGGCAPLIVHVSRLDRDRSRTAELLLSCAEAVYRDGKCEKIVIVGDGSEYPRLKGRADTINRRLGTSFVCMKGKQSDVPHFLEDRPVFIGVSRAALEAMASECTVILSGNEGYIGLLESEMLPCQYKENFCARSGKRANRASLLADIRRALGMPAETRLNIGRRSRVFVQEYYETARMAKDAERAYHFARARKSRGHTTILCGYFGYGNAGDELVLHSLMEAYRKKGRARIAVIGGKENRRNTADASVKRISKYHILALLLAVRKGDCFVLSGGNLLQNQTGNLSLLYYLAVAYLARCMGARVEIWRGGIGELHGRFANWASGGMLRLCAEITLRTPRDIADARRLIGERHRIRYECDAALLSPLYRFQSKEKKISGKYTVSLRIPKTRLEQRQTVALLRTISNKGEKMPLFLPFHQKEDVPYAKELQLKVGKGDVARWERTEDILNLMQETDFCITSRLHAVYASLLCGIPCYALDYDRKMRAHVSHVKQCARAVACPSPVVLIRAGSQCLPPLPKLSKGDYARLCAAMVTGGGL